MKITVEFDSEEEFKARIKNPRGGKSGTDEGNDAGVVTHTAPPPPLMPPPQGGSQTSFQPGATAQFSPPGAAFPGAAPAGVPPAVQDLVNRISARIDSAIAAGQPADQVLTWFRQQCGPEAANATLDQIKTNFLPKAAQPTLENIAKLMSA